MEAKVVNTFVASCRSCIRTDIPCGRVTSPSRESRPFDGQPRSANALESTFTINDYVRQIFAVMRDQEQADRPERSIPPREGKGSGNGQGESCSRVEAKDKDA